MVNFRTMLFLLAIASYTTAIHINSLKTTDVEARGQIEDHNRDVVHGRSRTKLSACDNTGIHTLCTYSGVVQPRKEALQLRGKSSDKQSSSKNTGKNTSKGSGSDQAYYTANYQQYHTANTDQSHTDQSHSGQSYSGPSYSGSSVHYQDTYVIKPQKQSKNNC